VHVRAAGGRIGHAATGTTPSVDAVRRSTGTEPRMSASTGSAEPVLHPSEIPARE